MSGIFISYRRDDANPYASRLSELLARRFGAANVFLDKQIPPGRDYVRVIQQRVDSCQVMLHLVGPRWLAIGEDGTSRLDDDADFVRFEIEYALESGVCLIPVLVGDAQMPTSEEVPTPIRPFLRKQAHVLDDDHWHYDVEVLERVLAEELGHALPTPSRPRRLPGTGVIAGSAAALAAAVAAFLLWPSEPATSPQPPAPQVKSDTFTINGEEPLGIAASADGVWLARASGDPKAPTELIGIDRASGEPMGTAIKLRSNFPAVAPVDGAVWITQDEGESVKRIDASGKVFEKSLGGAPLGIAASGDAVWISTVSKNEPVGTLLGLDPDTGDPNGVRVKVGVLPWGVATGEGFVWVANEGSDNIMRIDPETGETKSIMVGDGPRAIAVGATGVWVTNSRDRSVTHVDLELKNVRRIPVGKTPRGIALANGSVWVANEGSNSVTRIDAERRQVIDHRIETGESPTAVAADGDHVWVTNEDGNSITRLTPR